jgi:hypothetical protein
MAGAQPRKVPALAAGPGRAPGGDRAYRGFVTVAEFVSCRRPSTSTVPSAGELSDAPVPLLPDPVLKSQFAGLTPHRQQKATQIRRKK